MVLLQSRASAGAKPPRAEQRQRIDDVELNLHTQIHHFELSSKGTRPSWVVGGGAGGIVVWPSGVVTWNHRRLRWHGGIVIGIDGLCGINRLGRLVDLILQRRDDLVGEAAEVAIFLGRCVRNGSANDGGKNTEKKEHGSGSGANHRRLLLTVYFQWWLKECDTA